MDLIEVFFFYYSEIPFERDFKEFCYAEMRANNIPVYLEEDFMFKLSRVRAN